MISEYGTLEWNESYKDLQVPKDWLEYEKRSFYCSSVKNWNDIPNNIREQESMARSIKVIDSNF